jgi:hypothetical protein
VSSTTISNDLKALDELAGLPGWDKRKVQRRLARLALEVASRIATARRRRSNPWARLYVQVSLPRIKVKPDALRPGRHPYAAKAPHGLGR